MVKQDPRRMKLISFFVILMSHIIASAQQFIDYYNLRNESIFQFYNNNYQTADSLMSEALMLKIRITKDIYYHAIVNAHLKNPHKTKRLLELAKSSKGISTKWLESDKDLFISTLDTEWYQQFIDSVKSDNKVYFNRLQSEPVLKEIIDALIERDQMYRSELIDSLNIAQSELDTLLLLNDIKVQQDLIEIITKHGWPDQAPETLNTILLHFTPQNYYQYAGLILNEVKKGNLDPYWYASMVDRLELLINQNPCFYGIWGDCNIESNEIVKRRREIGLSPYWNGPFRLYSKVKFVNKLSSN